ncbi:MAG: hypothetical protein P4L31_05730 [Candidatus Babeliales bacterium]|nr:hypothetical protein [Candidatus Babeliales bacterium]
MNQKKLLHALLLLNFICSASINASSSSTSLPLKAVDQRPIPPTIEHTHSILQKNNPNERSYSQMSQLFIHDINYLDSDDEDYEKEEKGNHEVDNSTRWTHYCHIEGRHKAFIIEDIPETPPSKETEDATDSSSYVLHAKQLHIPSRACAIEALLKRSQDNNATPAKNMSRPRTGTF